MKTKLKRARIYYGTSKTPLFWTVNVTNAKKSVTINGSLMDALQGDPGQNLGCHLANCARNNAKAFGHPCIIASFTRSTALIVTKIKGGQPSEAIKYFHRYNNLVDLNDTDFEKKAIKQDPDLANRSFTLLKPWKVKPSQRGSGAPHGDQTLTRISKVPKGALARARKAGLVTADLEKVIRE